MTSPATQHALYLLDRVACLHSDTIERRAAIQAGKASASPGSTAQWWLSVAERGLNAMLRECQAADILDQAHAILKLGQHINGGK